MKKDRTTLAEVAGAAGVSVATVSKVLNDHDDVSDATRRRVRQVLRDTAYAAPRRSPGRAARSEQLIEVCFPEWQNAYETAVMDGITAEAESNGLEIVIGPRARADRVDFDPITVRRPGRIGAIFVTVDASIAPIKTLSDSGFPVVVVDPVRVGRTQCVSIGATNFTGGVTAVEHLLSLGHRRIAHAGGPVSAECSHARLAGYQSALRQADIATDESLVTHSLFTYDGGRSAAARLLDRPDRPTAIFAACDEIALGILEEARVRSIRVPQDLSVIGFDNSFLASRSAPPLTTVAQPLVEMGRLAVRSLTELIAGEVVATRHLELATHLVVRDSTAPVDTRR